MIYSNINSMTCDLDGTSKELTTELTMILHQFYELVESHHGEDFANEVIAKVGRIAVNINKE